MPDGTKPDGTKPDGPQAVASSNLTVDLGARSYDIRIGHNLLETAGEAIAPFLGRGRLIVIADSQVLAKHGERLRAGLAAADLTPRIYEVAPGEGSKSLAKLSDLAERILADGIDRKSLVVAFGGGVVGDLAGFAAAVLLRGLDFVQIPSTLLAQVDSSVGGKTGVNATAGKNLIGAFHQPRLVLADLGLLDSLPARELAAGYAEVVKYGLIRDAGFFDWLRDRGADVLARDPDALGEAVLRSCRHKAEVVAADEREADQRALLNLGHTFGHALEAAFDYDGRLLHGEAVAIGMAQAFRFSASLGLCEAAAAAAVERHLAGVGLPIRLPAPPSGAGWKAGDLLASMAKDKKAEAGRLVFVLTRGIGQAFVAKDVERAQVLAFLETEIAAAAEGRNRP